MNKIKYAKYILGAIMTLSIILLGVLFYLDVTKYNPERDIDRDGIVNSEDHDDNNDGVDDINDPNHPEYNKYHLYSDLDEDGLLNNTDPDDDNNGVLDINENEHDDFIEHHPDSDLDQDGKVNKEDDDDDGDSIPDLVDEDTDYDLDGLINADDPDDDNDGVLDVNDPNHKNYVNVDGNSDLDNDGILNKDDDDDDNDGIKDVLDIDHPECIFELVTADTSIVEEVYEGFIPQFIFHGEKTYSHFPILIHNGKIIQERRNGIFSSVLLVDTLNGIVHHQALNHDMCDDECGKGSHMNTNYFRNYVDLSDSSITDTKKTILASSSYSNFIVNIDPFSKGSDVELSVYSVLENKTTYSTKLSYDSLSDLYFKDPSYHGKISDNGRYVYLPILDKKVILDTKTNKRETLDENITPLKLSDQGEAIVYYKEEPTKKKTLLYYQDEHLGLLDNEKEVRVFNSSDGSLIIGNLNKALYIKGDTRTEVELVHLSHGTLTEKQKEKAKVFSDEYEIYHMIGTKVYGVAYSNERVISIDHPSITLEKTNDEINVVKKNIEGDQVALRLKFRDKILQDPSITFVNNTFYVTVSINDVNHLLAINEEGFKDLNLEVSKVAKVSDKLYATDGTKVYDVFDDNKVVYTSEDPIYYFFSFRNNIYFNPANEEANPNDDHGVVVNYTKDFKKINNFDSGIEYSADVVFGYFYKYK